MWSSHGKFSSKNFVKYTIKIRKKHYCNIIVFTLVKFFEEKFSSIWAREHVTTSVSFASGSIFLLMPLLRSFGVLLFLPNRTVGLNLAKMSWVHDSQRNSYLLLQNTSEIIAVCWVSFTFSKFKVLNTGFVTGSSADHHRHRFCLGMVVLFAS